MPLSIISVCERREAVGLDAHVPLILRNDAIYEAIDAKDRAVVGAQVKVIADAFAIEQDQWRGIGKPDRAQLAADSATRAAAIANAAGSGNWPEATTALGALNQPCRACHDLELPHK